MILAVVTRVPPDGDQGNLAVQVPLFQDRGNVGLGDPLPAADPMLVISLRGPVFTIGEILVLDEKGGREVGGHGRKPGKWDVGLEYFEVTSVAAAATRSMAVTP